MRKTIHAALALGLLVLCPSLAQAQAKSGDTELLLFGVVSSDLRESPSVNGLALLNLGQFVTRNTEIGGGPTITFSSSSSGAAFPGEPATGRSVTATVGGNFFIRQYFGSATSKVNPYFGVDTLLLDFKGTVAENLYLGGSFGIKNYLSEKSALDIKATYGFNAQTPAEGTRSKNLQVTVGFSHIF